MARRTVRRHRMSWRGRSGAGRVGSLAVMPAGTGAVYATEEPDALYERVRAAGATAVQGLRDEDYGSRGFTVRDPEGVFWSFGTYTGA